MENEKKRSKKKAIITLSSVLLFFVVMIGILAVGWTKKTKTQEEVVEEVWASTMTVKSADEFKRALEADAEIEITFTEDIVIREPLKVNGKKHLRGDGSIAMALDAEADQNILHVTSGSELTYDGVTVDGNSIASGIYVEKDAKLNFLSGQVIYAQACGLDVEGEASIQGGKITETIHSAVYVGASGTVDMTGGEIVKNGQYGAYITTGGYMKLSEDAVVQDTTGTLLQVTGTCDVVGVPLKDAGIYLVNAYGGTINISQEEGVTEKLELCNAGKWGLQVGKDGQLNVENVYLHDVGRNGVHLSVGAGAFSMENSKIQGTTQYGIVFRKTWEAATVKNVEISDVEQYYGIVTVAGAVVDLENITLSNIGERAIGNNGGYITAKNIVVKGTPKWGVTSSKSGDSVGELNIDGLTIEGTSERNAVNCNGSVVKIKNATLNNPKQMGLREHNGGKINATNVVIKNPGMYGMVSEKGSLTFNNVKIYNAGARGIASVGGVVTGTNAVVDTTKTEHGVTSSKNGKVTITGLTLKNVGTESKGANGFNVVTGSTMNITDATVSNVAFLGARVDSATLNFKNVKMSDTGNRGIQNVAGTVSLENVAIKNAGTYGVTSSAAGEVTGSMTIKGLTIDGVGTNNGLNCAGSVVKASDVDIKNVKLFGVRIHKGGTVDIKNVNIENTQQAGIYSEDKGSITVKDVSIKNAGTRGMAAVGGTINATNVYIDTTIKEHGVTSSVNGKVTITGLTLKNVGTEAVAANGFNAVSGSVMNITDATVTNVKSIGARAANATLNMTNVKLTDMGDRGIMNEAGTISLKEIVVKNAGTYGITSSASEEVVGSVTMTDITIDGVGTNSAINCAGSLIEAKDVSISGVSTLHGVRIHKAGTVVLNNVTIESPGEAGIYAEGDSNVTANKVVVTNAGTRGLNVQGGVTKITDIQIDTTKQHGVACSVAADVEINGLTLTNVPAGYNGINAVEASQVTVNGGSIESEGSMVYGVRAARETNVTLNDVDIKNTEKSAVYVEDATSGANLTNVTINNTNKHGVECIAGNVVANGLTITDIGTSGYAVCAYTGGKMEIHDTEVNGKFARGVFATNEGSSITGDGVIITAPTEHGIAASDYGAVALGDVTITDVQKGNGINAVSNSQVTVNGGSITNIQYVSGDSVGYGARAAGGATLTLSGVTVDNTVKRSLVYVNGATTKANLTNVTLTNSPTYGVECDAGTVEANELTLTNIRYYGVYASNAGNVKNDNVTVNGTTQRGLAAVGGTITGSNITVTAPTEHAITASSSAVVTLSDVTITGVQTGNGINAVSSSQVSITGGTIDGATTYGARADGGATLTLDGVGITKAGTNALIVGASSTLNLKGNSVIDGENANLRAVEVSGNFNMEGGTIKNFVTTSSAGAGVYLKGTGKFTMKQGTIENCTAKGGGAGVYLSAAGASVDVQGGTIKNCQVTNGNGGGIYVLAGTSFTMSGGLIDSCTASGVGGGIHGETNGTITVTGGTIQNCSAASGGGIRIITGEINGGTIDNCSATNYGGGILFDGASANVSMKNGTIQNCSAACGGAIGISFNSAIEVVMSDGLIQNCTATNGGAVGYEQKGIFTLQGGTIKNCSTGNQGYGGAVYVDTVGTFKMNGGEISANTAYQGGAIYTKTDIVMNGGTIQGNKAHNIGGAIRLDTDADFTMNDGQIINNQVLDHYFDKNNVQQANASYGAAIHGNKNNQIKLLKGTMSGNTSTGADTYGDKNAIQVSNCGTTTQITIGAEFVMGANSIRFSGLSSRTTPVVKITGTPVTANNPLYVAVSTSQEKHIQIGCDSADIAASILSNVISADNKTVFSVSGSNIVGAAK